METESVEKNNKSLALKTNAIGDDNSEESSGDDSDMENLNLLTKRLYKLIKMKGKVKNQQSKRYNKKPEIGHAKFT